MKARYQIAISLSETDYKKTKELNTKGIKIIDIYRQGLEEANHETSQEPDTQKIITDV